MSQRQIFKGHGWAERDVEELLQSVFGAELVAPSANIWLVSPWITDVAVIDNRTGSFSGLEPDWGHRAIHLVDVLAVLLRRGTRLTIATRNDDHNQRFLRRIETAAESQGLRERLLIREDDEEHLHAKGLLGDDYHLSGSMNLTERGIRLNDENVVFTLGRDAVSAARVNFRETYGVPDA